MSDLIRFLAAWALVHEAADTGWKQAVERGRGLVPGEPGQGQGAFVDGLAALIAEEQQKLKAELSGPATPEPDTELGRKLDALGFEIAELRGRIETLQATVDALVLQGKA